MASLLLTPRCTKVDGPACHRLLDDPEGVMAERGLWPDHICPDVAIASTLVWARDRAQRHYGSDLPSVVADWMQSYPLPVGRWSLPNGVPALLAPLPGEGKAAIILTPRMPFMEADAFGIVDDHPIVREESGGAFDMVPVAMQFMIAGWSDRADAFRDRAGKWWDTMAAKPITGRPRGSTTHTMSDYVRIFALVSARLGRPPTSLDEFIQQAPPAEQLAKDTVKRNLKAAGMTWGTFRRQQANQP